MTTFILINMLHKCNDRFILPLMKTTKYQNTVLFKVL